MQYLMITDINDTKHMVNPQHIVKVVEDLDPREIDGETVPDMCIMLTNSSTIHVISTFDDIANALRLCNTSNGDAVTLVSRNLDVKTESPK